MRTSAGRVAAVRAVVVPDWLAEVVRPRRAPVPWPAMIRAALAICVPLSVSLALGRGSLGVLPATGGLLGTMADTGGPYLSRVKRVCSAAVFGGAAGLAIGSVTHGHGWLAVVALIVVAGVSGVLSAIGDIGSVTGLQLLVYTSLGTGPLGALRPVWHTVAGFLLGVIWALILILPGWLLSPHGEEQRDVAAVYTALAELLRSVGTAQFTARRQALTSALNTAYDELLTARSTSIGRNQRTMRLGRALNASHLIAEAAVSLGVAGTRPPPLVIDTVARLADAVRNGTPPPMVPPPWDQSPAMLTLRDAMAGAARALARDWSPEHRTRTGLGDRVRRRAWPIRRAGQPARRPGQPAARRFRRRQAQPDIHAPADDLHGRGRGGERGAAAAAVVLGTADGGHRAQAGLRFGVRPGAAARHGTIVGAVAGAALLVLVHGTWLLIPFAALAALLPYGRSRNYGLLATFLTPLVVLLIDLLNPAGWRLAGDRLIDTLIGCAIVLVVGFLPWPMSWYSHLPGQYAQTALDVCAYLEEALIGRGPAMARRGRAAGPVAERRSTYRTLADLRAEFQRTMSEPPSISRRATPGGPRWWAWSR